MSMRKRTSKSLPSSSPSRVPLISQAQLNLAIHHELHKSGVVKTIVARLKREIFEACNDVANHEAKSTHQRFDLKQAALRSLVMEYLKCDGLEQTLSVYASESGLLIGDRFLSRDDALTPFNIGKASNIHHRLLHDGKHSTDDMSYESSTLFLILHNIANIFEGSIHTASASTQTMPAGMLSLGLNRHLNGNNYPTVGNLCLFDTSNVHTHQRHLQRQHDALKKCQAEERYQMEADKNKLKLQEERMKHILSSYQAKDEDAKENMKQMKDSLSIEYESLRSSAKQAYDEMVSQLHVKESCYDNEIRQLMNSHHIITTMLNEYSTSNKEVKSSHIESKQLLMDLKAHQQDLHAIITDTARSNRNQSDKRVQSRDIRGLKIELTEIKRLFASYHHFSSMKGKAMEEEHVQLKQMLIDRDIELRSARDELIELKRLLKQSQDALVCIQKEEIGSTKVVNGCKGLSSQLRDMETAEPYYIQSQTSSDKHIEHLSLGNLDPTNRLEPESRPHRRQSVGMSKMHGENLSHHETKPTVRHESIESVEDKGHTDNVLINEAKSIDLLHHETKPTVRHESIESVDGKGHTTTDNVLITEAKSIYNETKPTVRHESIESVDNKGHTDNILINEAKSIDDVDVEPTNNDLPSNESPQERETRSDDAQSDEEPYSTEDDTVYSSSFCTESIVTQITNH